MRLQRILVLALLVLTAVGPASARFEPPHRHLDTTAHRFAHALSSPPFLQSAVVTSL